MEAAMVVGGLSLALALSGAVLVADGAVAAPSSGECLACHGDEALAASGGGPTLPRDRFKASVHGVLACTDCHTDAAEIPHAKAPKAVGADACAMCHPDAVAAYRDGVHAAGRAAAAASCTDCHGDIHFMLPHGEPASAAHWSHLVNTCAACHANRAPVEHAGIPIAQPVEAYLEGVHGRAVKAGQRAAVCSDCHGSHAILPASNPRSTVWRANVPGTCGACHADVVGEFRDSVHGRALARGVPDVPVCTDCHGEHRILASSDPSSPVFARNIPSRTCGHCHGDLRLIAEYGLPRDQVPAFEDSFHGLALRAGQIGVANCASCHGVHDILPSSDPRSLVNPVNLAATCGKCHPGAGTTFAIGPVHVLPTASSAPVQYWIRLVYRWLITVVIGFMVLHNGVDLAVKARRRPGPVHPSPRTRRERMSRPLRWQHGLVMLSFPILAYTGFALAYPEGWWAAPLLHWESRVALRGALHRIAAVVLLGALAWHALHWWTSRRLRAQLRGLAPSWRDVHDFSARLAYYAGRRARPPGRGTFSYVEKVEYWAFVWGVLIMTGSGVPLWFSDATLRLLPKWVADVATTIHFYEAVLATLAIAVWHLYWVIFDPEVYPMDWSWWDGRSPGGRTVGREGDGHPGEGRGESE